MVYTEGDSALAGLMWNAHQALDNETTYSAKRETIARNIVKSLPYAYYANTQRPVVIDKSRAWTTEPMYSLIKAYFGEPKIIVCVRKIEDVIKSFEMLFERNGRKDFRGSVFEHGMYLAMEGVEFAKKQEDQSVFHFVDYDDLVQNADLVLKNIYEFLGLKIYNHNFNKIVNNITWDDSIYGLSTMHDVRQTIERRKYDI